MSGAHGRKRLKALMLVILVVICCLLLEKAAGGQVGRVVQWVRSLGPLGPAVFVGLNALGIVLFLPQAVFTLAAGILFGWFWGAAYSLAAMALGAVTAFMLARHGLRLRLLRHFGSEPMVMRMRDLSRSRPWHMLAVSRLVPVFHYALASYLLGLTEVRLLPFLVMSVLCLVPETLLLASGGHLVMTGLLHGVPHPQAAAALALSLTVLGIVVFLVRRTRRNR